MSENSEAVPFTKDKPVMILAVTASVLALANVLQTLIRLKSHDFKVPTQYVVSDGSVLQTSSWYTLYSLALFSLLGTGLLIFLAYRLHKSNKVFAAGVLTVQVILTMVSLIVSGALLGLVSRV
jgi:hypothetical protein